MAGVSIVGHGMKLTLRASVRSSTNEDMEQKKPIRMSYKGKYSKYFETNRTKGCFYYYKSLEPKVHK